jgi:predicted lipid-binding transport protein (Tim44 family)
MGGALEFFDIILFAVLALFLIFKLGSVLGRRQDDQKGQGDPLGLSRKSESKGDNVVQMREESEPVSPEDIESMDPLEAGIAQIRIADRSFREREFVKGARAAFGMIVEAFAKGDGRTLKNLLDGPVYENFAAAIREREKAGHELETTLVGIDEAEIISAEMQGPNAVVTIKFVSDQVNATRDQAGEIVEGDAAEVVQVTDIWTFSRDTRSSDPNWVLIATGSSN